MALLSQLDNPVLWQEYTHQQRTAPRWMRWNTLLGVLAVAAILVFVPLSLNFNNGYPTMQYALFATWIVHAAVSLRAIVAGANAISREHVALTWDALMLTGVSGRQVLLGKWRASLWRVRGWMVMLGVVRLAMLPVWFLAITYTYANYMCGGNYNSYSYSTYYCGEGIEFTWVPWAAVISVVMTVILTVIDVLVCTALGLAASAALRRGSTATLAAILIRFSPVVMFAAFTRHEIGLFSWRWWNFTPFALADGGTSPAMRLALPLMPWTQTNHASALPGLFLSAALLITVLVVSLVVAFIAIRRTGALPHTTAIVPIET
jgi:hypothetical protein